MAVLERFNLKNTSITIPSRGLGTFQVDPTAYPEGSVKDSVLHALKTGYRHIDTALGYGWGAVEREIGLAFGESQIPRGEIFIVTKLSVHPCYWSQKPAVVCERLWADAVQMRHNTFHRLEDVSVGISMSLKNLGMDYVDLYLMHFPYAYAATEGYGTQRTEDGKPVIDLPLSRAYDQAWAAMEALVDKGRAKLIGVSNFSIPKLKRFLKSARIHPVVNQVELHPYFPQKSLVNFCRDNNIHITAHCPLGGNVVPVLRARAGPGPLEDPVIKEIAQKYGRIPAQVILCFLISLGVSVIPKSNHPTRIEENFNVLFHLDPADFEKLNNLMGVDGEMGLRSLDMVKYLGFDNFNELVEEP